MQTNDIKKGMVIQLRSGWYGIMYDNMKGSTRMVKVFGFETEIGSVYAHDILRCFVWYEGREQKVTDKGMPMIPTDGSWRKIELTEKQKKFRDQVRSMGG